MPHIVLWTRKLWAVNVNITTSISFGKREVIADFGYAPIGKAYDIET